MLGENPVGIQKSDVSGADYIGQVGKNGEPEGFGREEWPDSFMYEGMQFDNQCNGYGRFIFINGKYYEGFIKDNECNGYGRLVHPDGKVFEGLWLNDEI